MIQVIFHKSFYKDYARLHPATKVRFKEKYEIFMNNRFDPRLQNHPLKGKMKGLWAFSIEKKIRVVYEPASFDTLHFYHIGSHDQVYE